MRIVTFADGFISVAAPSVEGVGQETYPLLNNQSSVVSMTGLIFDSTLIRTVFINYEIERSQEVAAVPETYKQSGQLIIVFDGSAWRIVSGNYVPDPDMLKETTIVNPEDVVFAIHATTGQMQYKTGDMTGTDYEGEARLSITRILA